MSAKSKWKKLLEYLGNKLGKTSSQMVDESFQSAGIDILSKRNINENTNRNKK